MLFDDHQQQGLYQSEEYGRCCFWIGDAKRFLTHGPFVPNWFELWDLYDKWSGENARKNVKKLHEEKNEEGKSVLAVKAANKVHEEKDELGRSLQALKMHEEKNEEGKSVHAVKNGKKGGKKAHEEKNEEGKSVHALEMNEKKHEEKDEEGKSIAAVKAGKKGGKKGGEKACTQRWMSTHPDWPSHITAAGPLSRWQKARGIPTEFRVRLPDDFEVVPGTS
jgi:hypothetical protein